MSQVREILVDDHDVVREGLCTLLQKRREFVVVGEADAVATACAAGPSRTTT